MKEANKPKMTTLQLVIVLGVIGFVLEKAGIPLTTICLIGLLLGIVSWADEEQKRREAKKEKDEIDSKTTAP